ncbi:hypothetical protein Tco_0978814 [Tanacetum coccineum]|uniref:Xylulose kinase-1 n=1 Tax=Tanacetum coccineum TaxID=301880 RepID=A0ABQ5EPG7_9ASTR
MSTLTFADTHNMVAFLEKPAESDGFHEIIDFLNANQICYALTVNPTIYTSCIEQFWATVKVKTVNGERQLQALVDKKNVIITETSIRSDLNLEDVSGTDCLPTDTIFKELARMGAKTTTWNEFSSTMASAIICLATNQKCNLSKYIFDAMTPITTQPSTSKPQKKQSRRKQRKDIEVSQSSASTEPITKKDTNEESVPKHSYDPSQSGEDRMKLHELMNLCTKLSDRVLALETTKTTQALEIASLKSRVKKLEKKANKRTHKFKRLYRVDTTRRVESSNNEVNETQGRSDDTEMFGMDAFIGDEVFAENDMTKKEHDVIPKEVSAAETLTTVGIKIPVSTAAPSTIVVSPHVITEVEITLAQTLAELKSAKSKVVIQEPVQNAGETTTRTPTSVSSSSIKDKGKAKMIELEVPLNKKDQIRLDEELEQDQGELTIEEKSKLFMELMNERKRHFAKLRAEEKRRKPLTKGQKRNQMCTYLKNIRGFTHNQVKNKSYEEIQKAFDKTMGWINNFKHMDFEAVKSSEKKAEGSRKKSIGKKRAGNEHKQESSKRQRMNDDKETDEHKEDDEVLVKKSIWI